MAPVAIVFAIFVGIALGYLISNTRHGDRIAFLNDQLNFLQKELERKSDDKHDGRQQSPIPFSAYLPSDDQGKRLTREQYKTISSTTSLIRSRLGKLFVARHLTPESVMFSEDIIMALERSGLELEKDLFPPDDPTQTGVMLACDDPGNVPPPLIQLMENFQKADIDVRVINMLRQAKMQVVNGCVLYIWPNHL